ncbi:MAG: DUF3501 family protein [Fidelibacterota bacterium]|nr:MAG: DUF3501 family protein [Candidatus Neomarinimicrobiota bacterium]
MKKITQADLLDIAEYEKIRDDFRTEVMVHKANRRIQLGPEISLTFEDRKTIIFQIQEMMRAERMVKEEAIQEEIDTYNTLLPEEGELSATLFIEITESEQIKEKLHHFLGLTDGSSLWLQAGEEKAFARFEAGRSEEDKISSVHYIRFQLSPSARKLLGAAGAEIKFRIDHGDYRYETTLTEEMRESLNDDLHPE